MNRLPRYADFIADVIDGLDKDENGKIIDWSRNMRDVIKVADDLEIVQESHLYSPDLDFDSRIFFADGSILIVYNSTQLHAPARVEVA